MPAPDLIAFVFLGWVDPGASQSRKIPKTEAGTLCLAGGDSAISTNMLLI